ncbi:MAG: YfiR family protein [bacterium]
MALLAPVARRNRKSSARNGASGWLAALALALSGSLATPAEAAVAKQYQVKAVFLFNFAQFVDWPPDAFPGPDSPFVIGVLGADPFGTALDQVVANERILDRAVVVRRFRDIQDVSLCHILFISASEAPRLGRILRACQGRSILTVGYMESFAESKGIIQFVLVNNRLRLRINAAAARSANLSISSQLLRQAELVGQK